MGPDEPNVDHVVAVELLGEGSTGETRPTVQETTPQLGLGNVDEDGGIEEAGQPRPRFGFKQEVVAFDHNMGHRAWNDAGSGPGDLERAVEDRHGDLGFVVGSQPGQHLGKATDVEGVGSTFSGAPASLVQYSIVVVIAVHG